MITGYHIIVVYLLLIRPSLLCNKSVSVYECAKAMDSRQDNGVQFLARSQNSVLIIAPLKILRRLDHNRLFNIPMMRFRCIDRFEFP